MIVLVVLIVLILLSRSGVLRRQSAAVEPPAPDVVLAEPAEAPPPPPPRPIAQPAVQPPAPTPTLDLLARLEARRRIQRAGRAVYLDSLFQESDSVLWRWPERPRETIRVAFVRDSLFRAASIDERPVREAFTQWSALRLGVRFTIAGEPEGADIVVSWIDRFEPDEQRTGQTDLETDGDGLIQQARITLALRDSAGHMLERAGLATTALHEVGHALGLGHSDRRGDIMNPRPTAPVLSDRDRRTAELIYGLPAGSIRE